MKRALVIGGTGHVGGAVVQALRDCGVEVVFTWHQRADRAAEIGGGIQIDLRDATQVEALFDTLPFVPDVLIHCAAVSRVADLGELSLEDWSAAQAVNLRAPFLLAQQFTRHAKDGGDMVFVGAMDRAQSLPIPAHFAATQGGLSGLTMALGRELAPKQIRVNMVALGVLDGGLAETLPTDVVEDYEKYSAFRRRGTAAEAARSIVWLALENTYMTGRVISANGGI